MKTKILFGIYCVFFIVSKSQAQNAYAGIVPNYSQFDSLNLWFGGSCNGISGDLNFNLDDDTLIDVKINGTVTCQMSSIGLKHWFYAYINSQDSSIEFSYSNGNYTYTCTPSSLCNYLPMNAPIVANVPWGVGTYCIYSDVYSFCVGGYNVTGLNYIPFRKNYGNGFYLYGWIKMSGAGSSTSFSLIVWGYTKLPNYASVINDTITCNASYTFVDNVTLNNIVQDTTYISTLVHPVTGLDSLVFTNIHVNDYHADWYDTICAGSSFTFADGSSAFLNQDTLKNNYFTTTNGCDSMITNHVTVKPNTSSVSSLEVCVNQLPYTWQTQVLTSPGIYFYQTMNAGGCDSSVSLQFTINTDTLSISSLSICANQLPYLWNGQSLTASGIYTYQTTNAIGCDSTTTLQLTINNSSTGSETLSVCSSQLPYLWNGQSLTASGTYTYQTTNAAGCDSTTTLQLTINNSSNGSETLSVCSSQLPYLWNGQSLTASGIYTYQTTNVVGCDSTTNLNFSVNFVDTNISLSGNVFTSNATNANYQWVQCNPYTILAGETNQTFVATAFGEYALIISQNSCIDTSTCLLFLTVSSNQVELSSAIQVYPNPASDKINVTFKSESQAQYELKIYDFTGRLRQVNNLNAPSGECEIKVSNLEYGVYLYKIIENNHLIKSGKLAIN